jgi:hypothetical protein
MCSSISIRGVRFVKLRGSIILLEKKRRRGARNTNPLERNPEA